MKRLIASAVLFCMLAGSYGQKSYTLSIPDAQSKEYIARDFVAFKPGYRFTAAAGNRLRAAIDKSLIVAGSYDGSSPTANTFDPNTPPRVLNQSLSTGAVKGMVDVSPVGAATYTVPITVPQGFNEIQPTVSLMYNSMGGDGIMGMGWSLSCVSAISRSGNNIYHDNLASGILFTGDDPLIMDGMRLICTNDPAKKGLAGTEFRTEADQNNIILKQNDGFIVKTTDGKTLEYGQTADARFLVKRGSTETTVAWLLNKMTDANGVAINYHYINNATKGEVYISSIDYANKKIRFIYSDRSDPWTGKLYDANISRSVLLENIELYSNGTATGSYNLKYSNENGISQLTEVTQTNRNGESVNATVFKWNPIQNISRYDVRLIRSISNFSAENIDKIMQGDFDGDGFQDLVVFRKKHIEYDANLGRGSNRVPKMFQRNLEIYKGSPNGLIPGVSIEIPRATFDYDVIESQGEYIINQFKANYMRNLPGWLNLSYDYFISMTKHLNDVFLVDAGDFNGDGIQEIVVGVQEYRLKHEDVYSAGWAVYDLAMCKQGSSDDCLVDMVNLDAVFEETNRTYYFYSCKNNAITLLNLIRNEDGEYVQGTSSDLKFETASVDFNQDGKSDLRCFESTWDAHSNKWIAGAGFYSVNDDFQSFTSVGQTNQKVERRTDKMWALDFNGDGLTDYAENEPSSDIAQLRSKVYIKQQNGNYETLSFEKGIAGITDHNGDGVNELIFIKPNSYDVVKKYSEIYDKYGNYTGPSAANGEMRIVRENNDYARITIITSYYITLEDYTGTTFWVWSTASNMRRPMFRSCDVDGDGKQDLLQFNIANGGLRFHSIWFNKGLKSGYPKFSETVMDAWVEMNFQLGDFDGDGRVDVFEATNSGYTRSFSSAQAGSRITEIIDGNNNRTTISYKLLTDPSVYERESSFTAVYPVASAKIPLLVVSEVKQNAALKDGNGDEIWDTNSYQYKNLLLHLQGKGLLGFEKTVANNSTQNRKQTKQSEVILPYYRMATKEIHIETHDGSPISTEANSNAIVDLGNKRFRLQTLQSVQTDHLTGTVTTSVNEYDSTNGLLNKNIVRYGEGTDVVVVTDMSYTLVSGTQNVYKPASISKTTTYNGQASFVEKTAFTYNGQGNLSTRTDFDNLAANKKVTTTYSNFYNGIPRSIQKSATGVSTQTTTYGLNSLGQITSTRNALGHYSTCNYDPISDLLTEEIDIAGNKTSYSYNAWGEPIQKLFPTGDYVTSSITWASNSSDMPSGALTQSVSSGSGRPVTTTWYDARGRELKTKTQNALGQSLYSETQYDSRGRVAAVSEPYFAGETPRLHNTLYDQYGRIAVQNSPAQSISYTYSGLTSTATNTATGQSTAKTLNAKGDVVTVSDATGNMVNYLYHSSGQPAGITAAGATTTMQYDEQGRQTALIDPDAGITTYAYNNFGQLTSQRDARGKNTDMQYDSYGRITRKISEEGNINYSYNALGLLAGETAPNGYRREYEYNAFGQLKKESSVISGTTYSMQYEYDMQGNITQKTFPSGFVLKYEYTNGALCRIKKGNNALIWELTAENSKGQPTQFKWGNNIVNYYNYDPNGFLANQNSDVFDLDYNWNAATGNLHYRRDALTDQEEYFSYDNLDRLTGINYGLTDMPTVNTMSMTYAPNGNISYKTGVGAYVYDSEKPHAVSRIESYEGNSLRNQQITYNSFGKVNTIAEGEDSLVIAYGSDGQRTEGKWYKNGSLTKTRTYLGDYEIHSQNGTTKKIHYIAAPTGLVAVVVDNTLFYACTDHLGSLIALVSEAGQVVERYSYDAWGRQRNANNWNEYSDESGILDRSYEYTGHESLAEFGLINMNGRVYDPVLGRMLSPDNYVQDPFNPQNYNRFGYCLNSPLKFTDPSGEFIFSALLPGIGIFLDAACWGATIGAASYTASIAFSNGGFNNWSWSDFSKAAGVGAVSGVVVSGVGGIYGPIGSMGFSGEIARSFMHGYTQAYITAAFTHDPNAAFTSFVAGGLSSLVGSGFMMHGGDLANSPIGVYAFAGLAGGIGAELTGENFWEGAALGLMNAGLNHLGQGINKLIYEKTYKRIGFVPLDEKVGFQSATYKMRLRIYQNGKNLSLTTDTYNTLVDGDVVANAQATLTIDGTSIETQAFSPKELYYSPKGGFRPMGETKFTIPLKGNVNINFQGGWNVYMPGGATVPVYHPILAPNPIKINDVIRVR
ncbi:MAG: hypothetical protein LBR81_05370 [Prevotellaceae bacterium]|jgi:RHS repeat-associated protein|nr:hypothetical protein [Prevotellaceae bacterium]